MPSTLRSLLATLIVATAVAFAFAPSPGLAESAAEIDGNVDQAIADLHGESADAKTLAAKAKGVLVFPKIIKGGFIVGAQGGIGALRVNGKTAGYYNSVAVSYGLQAGVQWFGYAMYVMNDEALTYLDSSDGWEVGLGPSIVVWDKGAHGSSTTSSLKDDIYVFFFEQEGLMAGLGLQGTKITKYTPGE